MSIRVGRLITTISLLSLLGYQTGQYINRRINSPRLEEQIVRPLRNREILLGAFTNHVIDGRHLSCFEQAMGQRMDIGLRYLTLGEPLPVTEMRLLRQNQRVIWLQINVRPLDVNNIWSGYYDEYFHDLGRVIRELGGRVMIGFNYDQQVDDWKKPQVAFSVRRQLSADNITWVWDAALGQPPAEQPYHWIELSIVQQTSGSNWQSFRQQFTAQYNQVRETGLPILLTVGSQAPPQIQAEFMVSAIMTALETEKIGGIVFFAAGTERNLVLSDQAVNHLATVLRSQGERFDFDIDGQLELDRRLDFPTSAAVESRFTQRANWERQLLRIYPSLPALTARAATCEGIERELYTLDQLQSEITARERIRELTQELSESEGSAQAVDLRQEIASLYVSLADNIASNNRRQRESLFQLAIQVLSEPLRRYEGEPRTPERFPIVPGYFELKLQIMARLLELGQAYNSEESGRIGREVIAELADDRVRLEEQVTSYTTEGLLSRVSLLQGQAYEQLNQLSEAAQSYQAAEDWALHEQERYGLELFWRGEGRTQLRQTVTLARMGRARVIYLGQDRRALRNVVRELIAPLFDWEEMGREEGGFMDQSFDALIYSYLSILDSTDSLAAAKKRFRMELPWWTINRYSDLKGALNCANVDFEDPGLDLWTTILEGLREADLTESQRAVLTRIEIITSIAH